MVSALDFDRIERSGFVAWLGTLCLVLGHNIMFSLSRVVSLSIQVYKWVSAN